MKALNSIFVSVLTSVLASAAAFAEVTISEVMAKNGTTLATASGATGIDWVELHNTGADAVDLAGWYLGNDPTKKTSKWPVIQGSCVVPANGYKIVWCDGDGVCTSWSGNEAHVACNISTEAGKHTVFLASAANEGAIVCRLPMREGLEDISYGYASATDDFRYFPTPTPGAANAANGRTGFTPKVAFSVPHGYKSEPFQLSLSCPDKPDAQIYYTLNGRKPAVGGSGSTLYTGPITISKTTVVRAAVPDADSLRQNDTSATYLFVADILTQSKSNLPEGFPSGAVMNRRNEQQQLSFGMRAASKLGDVDADTATARLYNGFTNGIRTVSLVLDPDDLFSSDRGIYVNAREEGKEWERLTMAEQIYPVDTNDEFSVACGLRIRGAFSRMGTYKKHAFRLFFRGEYGMSTLNHPLFGDEGPQSFGKIDLRCDENSSWANNKGDTTMIHEVWVRDTQRDMGQPYNKSRYYHLFLNGCYWGVYQTEERVDQKYCADTIGGEEDNYDVVRTSNTGGQNYTTGIVEGDTTAWSNFWHITMKEGYGKGHEDNYYRVRGLNPDGTRNPDYPIYLNVTNLICYMLTAHYGIDTDSPVSASIKSQNNVIGYRNRVDGEADIDGFIWNRHDAENSLFHPSGKGLNAYFTDVITLGTRSQNRTELKDFGPSMLNWELCQNAEYRRTFVDLVQKMIISPNGAMAPKASKARYRARMAEIDDAVMAELARWGSSSNFERRKNWIPACENDLSFFDQRAPYLVQAYRDSKVNWFPTIDAAKVMDASANELGDGDMLAAGDRVYLTGSNVGTVYYTTDGSDPCLRDGSVSDKALVYSGTSTSGGLVVPAQGLKIMARIKTSTEWSALSEVAIVTDGSGSDPEPVVFTGVYDEPVVISADNSYVFSNATLRAGLVVADGVVAKLNAATNTVNAISSVSAPCAEVRLTGDGTVELEGADTLMTVSNLVVKSGTFKVKSTGVAATKTPVVNVLGYVEQKGGVIDMDLDVATTNQIYGIYVANKDLKDASDNNLGVIYALFDGGEFNATVGAGKSAAVYVSKGSVDTTFKGGETITAVLKGTEPRFLNSAGDVEFKRVTAYVAMPEQCGSVTGARVFKSDKKIAVSDAEARFDVNVPGPDAEIFSAGDSITVAGGVFELVASDDCFSALNRIKVNGGLIYAVSDENDVFDSNGDMEINGGTILAYATAGGHEAFDVDPELTEEGENAHQLRVNGGTVFAVGGKSSVWPADIVTPDGFVMYQASDVDSSACSGMYASLRSTVDMVVTAKLPVFPASKCSLLMTCPNMASGPTFSPTAPSVGSQDFHDLYVEMQGETNQDCLRFLEIYGSTSAEGGDEGEYIVLTNVSDKVVQLAGVTVSIAKNDVKNGKIDDPKCLVTLGVGTVPAYGSVRLEQADYAAAGWTKITNGNIFLKLTDALGGVVQSGYASFDDAKYPGVDGGGEALVAIRFDATLEDSTNYWRATEPEPHEHVWGEPVYEWSADNAYCTATAACTVSGCRETTSQTVSSAYSVIQAPTETTDGSGRYTATFTSPFTTQTKDVVIDKTGSGSGSSDGHDGVQLWANGPYWATMNCGASEATRSGYYYLNNTDTIGYAVKNDALTGSLVRNSSETLWGNGWRLPTTAEAKLIKEYCSIVSTGTDAAGQPYVVVQGNTAGYTDKTVVFPLGGYGNGGNVSASPNRWGTYGKYWTSDTGIANRLCFGISSSGAYFEYANGGDVGHGNYYMMRLVSDTKPSGGASHTHAWGTPTYTWTESPGGYTCQGTASCSGCVQTKNESATVTYAVITPATTAAAGLGRYTATFSDSTFSTQTKDVEIAKLHEHTYNGTPTYVWSADHSTCTASIACDNSGCTEKLAETVTASRNVTKEPTTEETGTCVYTATFTNPKFAQQVETVTLPKLHSGPDANGHEYVQLWKDGPYWATMNVNATSETDYGTFFSWGSTSGYKQGETTAFNGDCQTFGKSVSDLTDSGYLDADGNLTSAHDAASVNMGGDWRMPTYAEWNDLIDNCTVSWDSTRKGTWVQGKGDYSSVKIFLPNAGYYQNGGSLGNLGIYGFYLSSTPNTGNANQASAVVLQAANPLSAGVCNRNNGYAIRGVLPYIPGSNPDPEPHTHVWGAPSYVWTQITGGYSCQGTASCSGCTDKKTESATVAYAVVTPATESATGLGRYTATFSDSVFSTQTKDVTIPKTTPASADTEAVQLWENGPYWAKTNLGTDGESGTGDFYMWGATVGYTKDGSNWAGSDGSVSSAIPFGNSIGKGKNLDALKAAGIVDANGILETAYDAANAALGGDWRLPTKAEVEAMAANCTVTSKTIDGVKGVEVRGQGAYAGNAIFLPQSGYIEASNGNQNNKGGQTYYLTATPVGNGSQYSCLRVDSAAVAAGTAGLNNGYQIRPVRTTPPSGSGTVDWDHPVTTIDAATSADVAWPTLAGSDLAKANASKLQTWVKNVGKVPFESAGGIKVEAFLLNCDNTDAAIETAKAEFKFASFDPDDLPTPSDFASKGYNGVVRIEGCNDLVSDSWGSVEDGDHFFRAVLTLE